METDRRARSVEHAWTLIEDLAGREVSLRILGLSLDTGTPTAKLMSSLLGAVAELMDQGRVRRRFLGLGGLVERVGIVTRELNLAKSVFLPKNNRTM